MMPPLDLNFAQPCRRFNLSLMLMLAIMLAIIAAFLVYQHQSIAQQITAKSNTRSTGSLTTVEVAPSATLLHSIALAHETQHALNRSWMLMLNTLEQVQIANPEVKLLSIQPNPGKSEIIITGQTAKFDDLVQYQNSLHNQVGLGEAVLLNQRTDVLETNDARTPKSLIGFTLAVGWKP